MHACLALRLSSIHACSVATPRFVYQNNSAPIPFEVHALCFDSLLDLDCIKLKSSKFRLRKCVCPGFALIVLFLSTFRPTHAPPTSIPSRHYRHFVRTVLLTPAGSSNKCRPRMLKHAHLCSDRFTVFNFSREPPIFLLGLHGCKSYMKSSCALRASDGNI